MALSPVQMVQQRKRAAREAAATAPEQSMAGATSYELQLAQLAQHRARLKQIQSTQGKAELKRKLLPEYVPYVDGVLSAGRGAQDEILTTIMLWRIDVGDYNGALDIASYVLEHTLKMPDRFERTTGCLIAEEIAEAGLNAQKTGNDFDLDVLIRAGMLTTEQDMPDQVKAKLLLATGRGYAAQIKDDLPQPDDQVNLATSRRCLAMAIELHSSCGGKKDLERVDRLIKKFAPALAQEGQNEPPVPVDPVQGKQDEVPAKPEQAVQDETSAEPDPVAQDESPVES
ncbi:MAG: phage terminase small subunit [Pseudomonas helleri]|uniref:phage terminase small subunit n=1 Tax=Pseudomonas helleri TaxID=1608996 RepID=UPI003F978F6F